MTIKRRIESLDWPAVEQSLWERGYAKTSPLLTPEECNKLIALYRQESKFRSRHWCSNSVSRCTHSLRQSPIVGWTLFASPSSSPQHSQSFSPIVANMVR